MTPVRKSQVPPTPAAPGKKAQPFLNGVRATSLLWQRPAQQLVLLAHSLGPTLGPGPPRPRIAQVCDAKSGCLQGAPPFPGCFNF